MVARGDFKLLSIVLSNLLENAWKFSTSAEKACIEYGSMLKDGHTVYFVKDNGIGFDPLCAAEIFSPFKKLHNEADYPGIGIGLNIFYRIISRHDGEIWAEGEPGQGACFFFTLP
jgi:light-regulated signal transduction histidine kinase (bacteriophytochrome)